MVMYKVVGSVEQGGAPVREGKSLTTKPIGKLGIGALVNDGELSGERLRFTKVAGAGPASGWVSVKLLCKVVDEKAPPEGYKGQSMLAKAEAAVEKDGADKALTDATSKGKDGAALLTVAVAQLSLGKTDEGFGAAVAAKELLKGNKDGEASCSLVIAAVKLATLETRDALTMATEALALFKEIGDRQMEASALTTAANARILLKEVPAALQAAKEALSIFRDLGDQEGEAAALNTVVDAYTASQGPTKALKSLSSDELAYSQSKGDIRKEGIEKQKMASALFATVAQGGEADLKEALKLAREALEVFQEEVGDKALEASALQTLAGGLLFGDGSAEEALKTAREALDAYLQVADKKGQVMSLNTMTNACLAKGDHAGAVEHSTRVRTLCKELEDSSGEGHALVNAASAHLAKGEHDDALAMALEAVSLCQTAGDQQGQANALQAVANVYLAKGGTGAQAAAMKAAKDALALFRFTGDMKGEATVNQMIAAMLLNTDGGALDALTAADRARHLFLMLGNKKHQGLASHAAAQGHLLMGDYDFGIQSAMQAVVLARDVGDKLGEAQALHTATNGVIAKGRFGEGLRMAKEVQALFKALGSKEMEESAAIMASKIQDAIPSKVPGPRTYIQPMDDARMPGQRSLFQENPNCVVWAPPINQQTYMNYCLELLKIVDDLKNQSSKTSMIVASQGTFGRQTGEVVPSKINGTLGMTVWAVVRTVRLESPRLHIASCDVPPASTAYEIVECLRSAMVESGTRAEVAYFVDRKQRMKGKF